MSVNRSLEDRIRAIEDRLEIYNLIASHPPSADTAGKDHIAASWVEDGVSGVANRPDQAVHVLPGTRPGGHPVPGGNRWSSSGEELSWDGASSCYWLPRISPGLMQFSSRAMRRSACHDDWQ